MLTLTIIALAAAGALGFWMRRRMQGRAERRRKESERKAAAVRQLEQDRLECLELERSLGGGRPGGG